jgi:hypothetical protein
MNSSIAWPYDSWELAAASEFNTAFFDCSRSGRRSTVLGLGRFAIFCLRAMLAGSYAAGSVWREGPPVATTRTAFAANFRLPTCDTVRGRANRENCWRQQNGVEAYGYSF